jgi:hypothetical protein
MGERFVAAARERKGKAEVGTGFGLLVTICRCGKEGVCRDLAPQVANDRIGPDSRITLG